MLRHPSILRRCEELSTPLPSTDDFLLDLWTSLPIDVITASAAPSTVHNLAQVPLTADENFILCRGPSFIPTPPLLRVDAVRDSFQDYERRLRFKVFFAMNPHLDDSTFDPRWYRPPSELEVLQQRMPDVPVASPYLTSTSSDLDAALELHPPPPRPSSFNLSRPRRDALRSLQQRAIANEFIIRDTDKNLGIAIVSRAWYEGELLRQLSDAVTYLPLSVEEFQLELPRVVRSLQALLRSPGFQALRPSALLTKYLWRDLSSLEALLLSRTGATADHCFQLAARFRLLPKVHKTPLKGRPIVNSTCWVSHAISTFIDATLQPTVRLRCPAHLVNSTQLQVTLESYTTPLQPGLQRFLAVADVASLYTNISIDRLLDALRLFVGKFFDASFPLNFFVSLCEWVLRNNFFTAGRSFDALSPFYRQLVGVAMGTPAAVMFAVIFMHTLEEQAFNIVRASPTFGDPTAVGLYSRYIDDVFAVIDAPSLDHATEHVTRLLAQLSALDPLIQFDGVLVGVSVPCLDLVISVALDGSFSCDVFQKALNKFSYIPYSSAHSLSCLSGFIKGELLRYATICSSFDRFDVIRHLFYGRLILRGYSPSFLVPIFRRVSYSSVHPARLARASTAYPRIALLPETPLIEPDNLTVINFSLVPPPTSFVSPVFKIRSDPLCSNIRLGSLIKKHWPTLISNLPNRLHVRFPLPLVAYRNGHSLRRLFKLDSVV